MPFHVSVACSQGCPLQRIEARISYSSLFMLQDVWVLESYPHWGCNEGRAYHWTPAFQLTMETLERLEGVASLSCVANIAGSDVQSPALISVRQECGWKNDPVHNCFNLEGPRSSQHRGLESPSWKGAQTLLYSQNAESSASEYLLSYLLTTLV